MSLPQKLTVQEVREYISDFAPNNYLIDGEEMSDTYISLCMTLAVDSYNSLPPMTSLGLQGFPSKSILLWGTLWHMYLGKAALLARNHMSYSDGGLQIPIEERMQLYQSLAGQYEASFKTSATDLKKNLNMEAGWGHVSSDRAIFPVW